MKKNDVWAVNLGWRLVEGRLKQASRAGLQACLRKDRWGGESADSFLAAVRRGSLKKKKQSGEERERGRDGVGGAADAAAEAGGRHAIRDTLDKVLVLRFGRASDAACLQLDDVVSAQHIAAAAATLLPSPLPRSCRLIPPLLVKSVHEYSTRGSLFSSVPM